MEKQVAARRAIKLVQDNMTVGLGSGTTVAYFIKYLGEAINTNKLGGIQGVPTSFDVKDHAREHCIPLTGPDNLKEVKIDIAIDGLDSILQGEQVVIKGGGGAFLQEKLVDYVANELVLIGDERKLKQYIPIPIEVLPPAVAIVKHKVRKLGGEVTVRKAEKKLGPVISDNGNIICDVSFPREKMKAELEGKLSEIPGILESGLFTRDARVLIGVEGGEKIREITI